MPIDASIILGGQAPKITTQAESLARVETDRLNQQKIQDQRTFEQIARETNGDPERMLQGIRAKMPHAAPQFEAALTKQRKEAADALKGELENETRSIDLGTRLLRGIRDESSYRAVKPHILKYVPDLAGMLPDAYDQNVIAKLGEVGLTAKEHAELTRKALDDYLDGKWRKGLGTALSIAQDEEDWNEALEGAKQMGAPSSEIALFGTFSPEAVQRAAQMTMTPNERQDNAIAQQNADTATANAAKTAAGGFTLGPNQRRYDANGKLIASGPAGSSGGGGLTAGDKALVDSVIKNPGIYSTLTPTARTKIAAALSERGFDFSAQGGGKPATGAQNRVLNFFNRARQADTDIQSVEGQIAKMGLGGQLWKDWMPNFMQSEAGQLYDQAQRAFTEARLRKDSGAAIPESEFANDRRTYFVQPGDTEAVIAQKARARAGVLASLAFEAGPALRGFYGDEADAMVEGYRGTAKSQQGASTAPAAAAGGRERVIGPNGETGTVPVGTALPPGWRKQ